MASVERTLVDSGPLVALLDRLQELQFTYRDLPRSLADACLVRMSELHSRCRVFTTDSDFRTYRRNGRQVIPTLMPDKD